MSRKIVGRIVEAACLLTLVWSAIVAMTGGFRWQIGSMVVGSREPYRPLAVAVVLALACGWLLGRDLRRQLEPLQRLARRAAPWIAGAAAAGAATGAWVWGTFAASGADSYGYVSQAYLWLQGSIRIAQPLAARLPWPHADSSLTPIGYTITGVGPHLMVPVYSPGLPLLMAAAARLGGACAPFAIVPLCTALLVWCTYALGRRLDRPSSAAAAAVLVALSPIVLFQSAWPMSDVPVAALWTAALVLSLSASARGALFAGLAGGAALLVRPNLVLIPAVMLVWIAIDAVRQRRSPIARPAAFAAPLAVAAVVIALCNTYLYGAPLHSGYGSLEALYATSNLGPNLAGYGHTLLVSQTAFAFLFIVPFAAWLVRRVRPMLPPRVLGLLGAYIAAVWLSYVFYLHFPDWWYLRFLLPALPVMLLLGVVVARRLARRIPSPWGALAFGLLLLVVAGAQLRFAQRQHVFGLVRTQEHRYIDMARYIDAKLPPNAAILSMQHSGSVRFYAGRLTVRYDWLQPPWLTRAPAVLETLGFHAYLLVDDWELPSVRQHLGIPKDAPLPWSMVARMRKPAGVALYDTWPARGISVPVTVTGTQEHDCTPAAAPRWK